MWAEVFFVNQPVRRIRSVLLPSAMWAAEIIAAVIGIVFRSRWVRLGSLSTDDVIVLAACMGLVLIMFAIIASFRLVIDERGATQHGGIQQPCAHPMG